MYSFSRCFYPKRLTIEEYNRRYIIKRQTVTGSACNTTFQALFRAKLARLGEVKEREQRFFFFFNEGAEVKLRLGLGIKNRFRFQNWIPKVRNRILVVKLKSRFRLSIPMRFFFLHL